MHQDSAFTDTKPDAFATAWVAMQEVTPEMGALVGYPGTHREPILPQVLVEQPLKTVSQDPNANREEVVLPTGYQPVELAVPRGAAIFMHGHFVHSSGMNRTNQFRRALVLTYIRSGENFRPGVTAKRSEVQVY
jgi:ectoine hydroxylase-related dioxygenase (phytanoyl-CoA dioxygenase family)